MIVLSAGGTGGHLFPAQALAGELVRRGQSITVMTDARFADYATVFPGARIETVPSSPLNSLLAPLRIGAGILSAFAKLNRIKPSAVIGFGGYPSLPVMLAAMLARLPTAIIEQNAVMGRANRLVMDRVRMVATAFPVVRPAPKAVTVTTGNPLRPEVIALWGAPYVLPVKDGAIRVLVFGGSQGARALSQIVPAALTRLPHGLKQRLQLVQQCRGDDLERVREIYANAEIHAELQPFFNDLPARMAAAHLVIGRAGAGTVSELMAIGRPAILVPLPSAMDDHQTANAQILSHANAAWLAPQGDLSRDSLAQMIGAILVDPAEMARRAVAAHAMAMPNATGKLADMVEDIAGRAA